MLGLDLALFCGEAQGLRADAKHGSSLCQVHPPVGLGRLRTIDWDSVVAAKRCHPFTGPAIAVSSANIIAIEQARDHVVAADARQQPYRLNDFLCSTVARLSSPAARYAQFGMNTSHPVNDKDDLSALRVNVGDHFANEFAHNAFLQTAVSARITPDRLQISCQHRELLRTRWRRHRGLADMPFNSVLQFGDALERAIPA